MRGCIVIICTSTSVGTKGMLSCGISLKYLRTSAGDTEISFVSFCCIPCTIWRSRKDSRNSARIWLIFFLWYSSSFSREPIADIIWSIYCSTPLVISDSVTSTLSVIAWLRNNFWTAICSGIEQSGSPDQRRPSCSLCRRIASTSDFNIASSPTTHITSSTMERRLSFWAFTSDTSEPSSTSNTIFFLFMLIDCL